MNAPERFYRDSVADAGGSLLAAYHAVRAKSAALAAVLSPEDCQPQSMPDASPVKWHLAHTTWFFETFLLGEFASDYVPTSPQYRMLFNSYYNAVGDKHPRPERGLLTRPTLDEVMHYRARVDESISALISGDGSLPPGRQADFETLLVLGLNHEQQHQELILTDVKHLLSCNPLGRPTPGGRRKARRRPPRRRPQLDSFASTAASSPSVMTVMVSASTMRHRHTRCCCSRSSWRTGW